MSGPHAARPHLVRRVNAATVLSVLARSEVMTASDLMDETGLTRATVHAVCNDLVEMGWVAEVDPSRESNGHQAGRPSRRLRFDERAGYVLGVGMGAGRATLALADLRGTTVLTDRLTFRDPQVTAAERLGDVNAAVQRMLDGLGEPRAPVLVAAIGVAAPVDRSGRVVSDQWFWTMFDVGEGAALDCLPGTPVLLENDANLAALAERWCGIATGVDDLAVLLAGERLGAGLLESGHLLRGSRGGAGEMGYLQLVDGVGSAAGIAQLARRWAAEAVRREPSTSVLAELSGGVAERIDHVMVFDAARRGDPMAVEILSRLAERTARVVATLGTFINPELVVIGGPVAEVAAPLLDLIHAQLPRFTATPPRVAMSVLGASGVSVGAVRYALDYVEENALDLQLRR